MEALKPAEIVPETAPWWTLVKRSHPKAARRIGHIPENIRTSLISRLLHIFVPWEISEYPGKGRFVSSALTVPLPYAKRLCSHSPRTASPLTIHHIDTLLALLDRRASDIEAVRVELTEARKEAAERDGRRWRGCAKMVALKKAQAARRRAE